MQPWDATNHEDQCSTNRDSWQRSDRRVLIGAAAASFVLSASGLFLLDTVQEAEARSGANDGQLGGRHGKNHRSRDKNRHHGKHKDKKKRDSQHDAGNSLGTLNVAIYVHNQRNQPVSVRGWKTVNAGRGAVTYRAITDWITIPAKQSGGTEPFSDFVFPTDTGIVQIGTDHWVLARNPPVFSPNMQIGTGGWSAAGRDLNSRILVDKDVAVDEAGEADNIRVQRTADSGTHKQFYVFTK